MSATPGFPEGDEAAPSPDGADGSVDVAVDAPDAAAGPAQDTPPVDWTRLPDAVRARLADAAATAVGGMPAAEVPVSLRRLARFTPAKRAKLGGQALTTELAASPVFRT